MNGVRDVLTSIGIALAVLGLLLIAVPGAAGALPLPRLTVVVLGIAALVEAVRSLRTRRRTSIESAELPEPEAAFEAARPGDAFDERVTSLGRRPSRTWAGREHERLRRRLRASAVEATAHRWRLSTEEARERVETGRWTDDPVAATYLGGPEVPAPPWRVRVRAALVGSSIGFYANRTADAIVALREGS